MVYLHFEIIVFAWNAQCFTIFCVLLHVFLPALSRTLNQYRVVSSVSSCKPVFLILKISQYGELRWQVQLFLRYSCKNWYKNWYLHFPKNYDHQIWQAGTLRVDLSETNHASAISTTRVPIAGKLWRMVTYRDGLLPISCCPQSRRTLWLQGLARSHDKLKPLYLYYHDAYAYQAWQECDLQWGGPTHTFRWPFDHMVSWDHVKN